ncbi:Nucleolar protein 16 [Rhizophlyctis rosea]|nr:Nucleolar protein 16 [Rhizophlyctis rosea]
MARPRQRRKTKMPSLKVSRRQKNPYDVSFATAHPVIQKNWDKKLTLRQNYRAMGLLPMLNGVAGGTDTGNMERGLEEKELEKARQEVEWRVIGEEGEERGAGEEEEQEEEEEYGIEGKLEVDERVLRLGSKVSLRHLPSTTALPAPPPTATSIIALLEAEAASAVKLQRKASEQEARVLLDLVRKHGLEYDRMARDLKLNRYQLTTGQLRKKFEKLQKGGVAVPKIEKEES